MTTISVSNQTQLLSVLKTVKAGDTIQLAAGNYGSISLNGSKGSGSYLKYADEVKIVSASATDQAVIEKLSLIGVNHLTFENIKFDYTAAMAESDVILPVRVGASQSITFRGAVFDGENVNGYGVASGIKFSEGKDILLENSTILNYRKGIESWAVDGLTIQNNKIQGISYDGMVSGHVQGLTIRGNTITMNSNPAEDIHRDVIQIYNQGSSAPSSDILIQGNTLISADIKTHGIYLGNYDAKATGSLSEFYADVVIRDNKITSIQKLGIAVGQADGVTITGNTLIQHDAAGNNPRPVQTPTVLVAQDSVNVAISGNILNTAPLAADDAWQKALGAGNDWNVSGNSIVGLDWKIGDPVGGPVVDVQGNGVADEFRFQGTKVTADRVDVVSDAYFGEGDKVVLIHYEPNTFKGVPQGNKLDVNSTGDYVKINSMTDLQELATTSPKVSAEVSGDTLTLHITQTHGVQDIVLEGLGQDYQSTFNASQF